MHDTLQAFKNYCGQDVFKNFLSSLRGQARVNSRLLDWQERLLANFEAKSGTKLPDDLDGILTLFRQTPVIFTIPYEGSEWAEGLVEQRVVRKFHSVNQMASGGSHVTIFSVSIGPSDDPNTFYVADMTYPGDGIEIVPTLMDQLSKGIKNFIQVQRDKSWRVRAFCIELLDFVFHDVDIKPYKYATAIQFVLEELLCESRSKRFIEWKLVGIPV
jgi:hypothetical protein